MCPCSSPTEPGAPPARWNRYARAAMRHVDTAVRQVGVGGDEPPSGRESRQLREHALHELVRRQERLQWLHARIEASQGDERARLWQRFFLCYDDFIAALQHDARLRARATSPRGRDQSSSTS